MLLSTLSYCLVDKPFEIPKAATKPYGQSQFNDMNDSVTGVQRMEINHSKSTSHVQ